MNVTANSTITFSNQQGSRDRAAWLLLVKGEEVRVFTGETIPGLAVVVGSDYHKNGKWSHTTYRIALAPGVRAIPGKQGWETNTFAEGLRAAVSHPTPIDRWPDLAAALGISVPAAMQFLRGWKKGAAEKLDAVDAQLEALEQAAATAGIANAGTETVVVSFGGPTNRQRSEGFWTNPKPIGNDYDGSISLIDPDKGWVKENIRLDILGSVLSVTHTPGYGGGYVKVTLALVP